MDSGTTQKLHDVYGHFSDSPDGMDGLHFARLCRDLNLELVSHNSIPSVPATTFDIIFARAKARNRRRLDFNQFLIALDLIGQKLNLSIEEVIRAVNTIQIEDQLTMRNAERSRASHRGPERFYYDSSTYTGTHRLRKSTVVGNEIDDTPSSRVLDLKEIVNRDGNERWATPKTPQRGTTVRRPSTVPTKIVSESSPVRGPERFFYDKSTYTGIHKQNNPTIEETDTEKENLYCTSPHQHTKAIFRKSAHGKRDEKTAPSLPATAAGSLMPTPLVSSSLPSLMTPEEFLAAELNIMPIDNYFSSFLRRPN